jgi:hypothetical protein
VLRGRQRLVCLAHGVLRAFEPRVAVSERRFARLEVAAPRRHLFGQRAVGL